MVVWSTLRCLNKMYKQEPFIPTLKRCMSGGHGNNMHIDVSRWPWQKFKDLLHMYFMIGIIPSSLIVLYSNLFIGPAQLAEIPEGYTPKHWEYFSHPITRFIARYTMSNPQQEYEKYLHLLYEEDEKVKMRRVTKMVKQKMAERHDYEAYYYVPVTANYHRYLRSITDDTKEVMGDN